MINTKTNWICFSLQPIKASLVVEVQIVNVYDDDDGDMNIDEHEAENNEVSDNINIVIVNDKLDVMDETNEKVLLDKAHYVNEYKCLTCGFKTNSKEDIKKHKLSVHNLCSVCFSSFSNQDKLNNNISKQHKSVWYKNDRTHSKEMVLDKTCISLLILSLYYFCTKMK